MGSRSTPQCLQNTDAASVVSLPSNCCPLHFPTHTRGPVPHQAAVLASAASLAQLPWPLPHPALSHTVTHSFHPHQDPTKATQPAVCALVFICPTTLTETVLQGLAEPGVVGCQQTVQIPRAAPRQHSVLCSCILSPWQSPGLLQAGLQHRTPLRKDQRLGLSALRPLCPRQAHTSLPPPGHPSSVAGSGSPACLRPPARLPHCERPWAPLPEPQLSGLLQLTHQPGASALVHVLAPPVPTGHSLGVLALGWSPPSLMPC